MRNKLTGVLQATAAVAAAAGVMAAFGGVLAVCRAIRSELSLPVFVAGVCRGGGGGSGGGGGGNER